MARKQAGRPPKRGKWKYVTHSGVAWANLGMKEVALDPTSRRSHDTDGEVKKTARRFFRHFLDNAKRLGTPVEQQKLYDLLDFINALQESEVAWVPSSFESRVWLEWACSWGEQGTARFVMTIDRYPAERAVGTGGLL